MFASLHLDEEFAQTLLPLFFSPPPLFQELLFGGGDAALDAFGTEAGINEARSEACPPFLPLPLPPHPLYVTASAPRRTPSPLPEPGAPSSRLNECRRLTSFPQAIAGGRADVSGGDESIAALVRSAVRARTAPAAEDGDAAPAAGVSSSRPRGGSRAPVWVDEADEAAAVDVSAVPRLRKLRESREEGVVSGGALTARLRAAHAALNPRTQAWGGKGGGAYGRLSTAQCRLKGL